MDIEVWSCLFVINLLAFIDIMARAIGERHSFLTTGRDNDRLSTEIDLNPMLG